MIETSFFIYMHRRLDTGAIFYIGKGTHTQKHKHARAHSHRGRSKYWASIVAKAGYSVEICSHFILEKDAFAEECRLIAEHGRKNDGGILCNLSLGGDGPSGLIPTLEQRAAQSARVSGSGHPNWGKTLSKETCIKKSESMRASPDSLRGKRLPDWWRKKIADAKHGADNPMYGKKGSDHPLSRAVLLSGYNMVFESISEAADFLGMSLSMLHAHLTGITKVNKTNMELI